MIVDSWTVTDINFEFCVIVNNYRANRRSKKESSKFGTKNLNNTYTVNISQVNGDLWCTLQTIQITLKVFKDRVILYGKNILRLKLLPRF